MEGEAFNEAKRDAIVTASTLSTSLDEPDIPAMETAGAMVG